ncbi:MAG: HAD-IA family hydrolase [Clostridia bacterium]|nr:HAD-IA family hydrolase [Clostridia bacterium]
MIKSLLFDCSDTLLHLHSKVDLAVELGDHERAERIHNAFFGDALWKKYDNGLLSDAEMKDALLPRFAEADREIAEMYFDTFADHYTPIEGMYDLLAELKRKGYSLYIVSDFPPRFARLWEKYEIFRLFDGRAVSCEAHGSKQDLRLFSYLLETYGLRASECFFVDDREDLVSNAALCGIAGHAFVDAADLRDCLRRQSIL